MTLKLSDIVAAIETTKTEEEKLKFLKQAKIRNEGRMISGYVNYCENSDVWILVKADGDRVKINDLVYGVAQYLKEWEIVCGEGEYIKVSLEVG